MVYGGYFNKKDAEGAVYNIKMDVAGSIRNVKTGVLDGKAVPDAGCTGCKRRIVNSRRYIGQTVRAGLQWTGRMFCFINRTGKGENKYDGYNCYRR